LGANVRNKLILLDFLVSNHITVDYTRKVKKTPNLQRY
jgi:hypothetical protein